MRNEGFVRRSLETNVNRNEHWNQNQTKFVTSNDETPTISDFISGLGENPRKDKSFKKFLNRDLLGLCSKWSSAVVSQKKEDLKKQNQEGKDEGLLITDPEVEGIVSTLKISCARLEIEAMELISSIENDVEVRQGTEWDCFNDTDGVEDELSNLDGVENIISREIELYDISSSTYGNFVARKLTSKSSSQQCFDNHTDKNCATLERVSPLNEVGPNNEEIFQSGEHIGETCKRMNFLNCLDKRDETKYADSVQPRLMEFLLATGEQRPQRETSLGKLRNEELQRLCCKWTNVVRSNQKNDHSSYQDDFGCHLTSDPTIKNIVSNLKNSCARLEVDAIEVLASMGN